MPDIPTDDSKRQRHLQRWQRRKHRYRQPIKFSALIDTIRDEGHAHRKEEQREGRGKRFREWITIVLITRTFAAVCYQVYEMIKVYEPIREQAEAAKSAANATKRAADAATAQSEIATKQAEISATGICGAMPFTCTSRQINRSERIAKTYPTTSVRIISSGSIDGRPMDE